MLFVRVDIGIGLMSQDLRRLKQLRERALGARMQLDLIESDLIAVAADINFLNKLLDMLSENIVILKSEGIIALASEYKKITQELKTAKENLSFYRRLQGKLSAELEKYKRIYETSLKDYDDLKNDLDSRVVVVKFDPSKRKK